MLWIVSLIGAVHASPLPPPQPVWSVDDEPEDFDPQEPDASPAHPAADAFDAFSCQLGPVFTTPGVAVQDYLGNYCGGSLQTRSTEMDWLRFFWQLMAEEPGVSFTTIASIYGDADSHTWAATSTIYPWVHPFHRMRSAADANGVLSEFDDHAVPHGVFR